MNQDEILLARSEFLFPAVFHLYREPLVLARAKDQYVWDAAGRQYLDFFGGIVTVSIGHCNDEINARVHRQLDTLGHTSTLYSAGPTMKLAQQLAAISPGGKLTRSMFTSTGSEANETAIHAARMYTGNSDIIALRHSYHGRSQLAAALTGNQTWRNSGPPAAGVTFAHNAYCYRCPFGLTYPNCELRCATDIKDLIRTTTSGHVAGMIAEPIQGVGGFITPPPEYFGIVADTVRQHGGVFISDEVQTAWGRTGDKWFGIEHWGVTPDILTSAKGLANGLPIGLTLARDEVARAVPSPTIATFGGNPISTEAACAVLDFIDAHGLRARTAENGTHLREGLLALQAKHSIIGDVRGMGLLQAIELVTDRASRNPAAAQTSALLEAARELGLLLGKGGLNGNCVRISPPMNIAKSDIDEFLLRLDRSFETISSQ
ncbi:MAG: aspartate aminotransferase family protein [Acidobacteriota bacterium]